MDSRGRILTSLNHQEPDRVPSCFAADEATTCALLRHFHTDSVESLFFNLGTDGFMTDPGWVHPRYVGPPEVSLPDGEKADFWGIVLQRRWPIDFVETLDDLERYPWPKASWFDYTSIRVEASAVKNSGRIVIGGEGSCGIYQSINMRGYEKALTDSLIRPDLTRAYMERMSDFFTAWNERWLEAGAGEFDLFRCGDEVGNMQRMLLRPEIWRKFYKPHLKKVWAVALKHGLQPWWHCCGCCRPVLEDMLEIGMRVWDSVPPYVAGNDLPELKRRYGKDITFVGGVDQLLLARGTPQEVIGEVQLRLDQLAPGGGCILGPSQALTNDIPLANILALYEAISRFGNY